MAKKTKEDPTGQRVNRDKTKRRLLNKLELAKRSILKLVYSVPYTIKRETIIANAEKSVFVYDLNPAQLEELNKKIKSILNDELLETQDETPPPSWWYKPEVELPIRQGTLEELNWFNQLIALAVVLGIKVRGMEPQKIPVETFVTSRPYLDALQNVYIDSFSNIKTLSNNTASQVIQQLNSGIKSKLSISKIAENITERFDVSKSKAKRIAETEVNKAYNNSKLRATELAANISGLRAGVIHISALTSTTRPQHAARHGNAYTVSDQEQWWDTGSNRINCKCTVRSALIDENGNVVQREAR